MQKGLVRNVSEQTLPSSCWVQKPGVKLDGSDSSASPGKRLACDARTWGAALSAGAGPPSWHPGLLKRGAGRGRRWACPEQVRCRGKRGSETRPSGVAVGGAGKASACSRYRPKADDSGGLQGAEAASPLYCRPINKLPSNWQNGLPAAPCLFLPRGTPSPFLGPPG